MILALTILLTILIVVLCSKPRRESCYKTMEYSGIAAFGCCKGKDDEECLYCTHYVLIDEEEKDNLEKEVESRCEE